jgi:hypothetical protein
MERMAGIIDNGVSNTEGGIDSASPFSFHRQAPFMGTLTGGIILDMVIVPIATLIIGVAILWLLGEIQKK